MNSYCRQAYKRKSLYSLASSCHCWLHLFRSCLHSPGLCCNFRHLSFRGTCALSL